MEFFLLKEETIKLTLKFLLQKVQTRRSLQSAQIKINKILDKLQQVIVKENNFETQKILAIRLRSLKAEIKEKLSLCVTDTKPFLKQNLDLNLSTLFEESDQIMANRLDLGLAIKMVDKFSGAVETLESWISDVMVLRDHENEVPEADFLRFMRSRLIGAAGGSIERENRIEEAYTALRRKFAIRLTPIAVEAELRQVKQKNKSITDFGQEVEKLAAKLAAAHVSKGTFPTEAASYPIVQPIAVSTFINGLKDHNTAFLTLSRNPETLPSAISHALELQNNSVQESVLWAQTGQYSGRGRGPWRGGNRGNNRGNRGNNRGNGRGYGHRENGYRHSNNHQQNENPRNQRGQNQRRGAQAHVAQEAAPEAAPELQQRREEVNLGELFRE